MAMVRESVALTSSSASPRLRVSPPRAMTSSPKFLMFGGGRSMNALPEFKGLKIQSPLKSSLESLSLRMPRVSPHNIVSEAQETALDVPTVNETTWESLVLKADGPVLVEFWASWCGPCRMIHPVIDEIAKQYAGKLKCFRLNTDESPSIASDYGIRSIPTLMIFVNGEKKEAVIGAVPKTTLTVSIEKFL